MTYVFAGVFLVIIMASIIGIYVRVKAHKEKLKSFGMLTGEDELSSTRQGFKTMGLLKKYKLAFKMGLDGKKVGKYSDIFYVCSLVCSAICILIFTIMQRWVVGVILVIIGNVLVYYVLMMVVDNLEEAQVEQLPIVIDEILKEFTRATDLKLICAKVALRIDKPLRKEFDKLAKDMLLESPEKAINAMRLRMDNNWFSAFCGTLTAYTQTGKLEDIKYNLQEISMMITGYSKLKTQNLTDKRYGIVVNYVLIMIGIGVFVVNLIYNPIAESYFFNTMAGMMCLFGGFIGLGLALILNLSMTFRKRGAKQ